MENLAFHNVFSSGFNMTQCANLLKQGALKEENQNLSFKYLCNIHKLLVFLQQNFGFLWIISQSDVGLQQSIEQLS